MSALYVVLLTEFVGMPKEDAARACKSNAFPVAWHPLQVVCNDLARAGSQVSIHFAIVLVLRGCSILRQTGEHIRGDGVKGRTSAVWSGRPETNRRKAFLAAIFPRYAERIPDTCAKYWSWVVEKFKAWDSEFLSDDEKTTLCVTLLHKAGIR